MKSKLAWILLLVQLSFVSDLSHKQVLLEEKEQIPLSKESQILPLIWFSSSLILILINSNKDGNKLGRMYVVKHYFDTSS